MGVRGNERDGRVVTRRTFAPVFALGQRRTTQYHAFLDRKVGDAEMRRDYAWRHLRVVEEHRSSLRTHASGSVVRRIGIVS